MSGRFVRHLYIPMVLMLIAASAALAGPPLYPVPIGTALTTVRYDVPGDTPLSYSESLGYFGPGAGPANIQHIEDSANIGGFIAYNTLGRRTAAIANDPSVQAPDETLMRHGLYKSVNDGQVNPNEDFFAGIDVDGNVTIKIEDVTFDRPVKVDESTFLMHSLWNADQLDNWGLDGMGNARLFHMNNHNTVDNFRDESSFFLGADPIFKTNPNNYAIGTIAPTVTYTGPNQFDVEITFPYSLLAHLEDDGLGPPANPFGPVPSPGGFLEPFHLHLEYIVQPVPEPGTLALLACGGTFLLRRRRK